LAYLNRVPSLTEVHFHVLHLSFFDLVGDTRPDLISAGSRVTSVYLYSDLDGFEDSVSGDIFDAWARHRFYEAPFGPKRFGTNLFRITMDFYNTIQKL
jgi:hypothetical protein